MNIPVNPAGDPTERSSAQQMSVIGLISAGHFISHFYVLCLAPLLPAMADDLQVGYAELGLITSGFFWQVHHYNCRLGCW